MSVTGSKGVGIPIILLHDAEGGLVEVEMKNGDNYRGQLSEAQDNMNITLKNCVKTTESGEMAQLQETFIRGSKICFVVIPDMLSKAPIFTRITTLRTYGGHKVVGGDSAKLGGDDPGAGGRGRGRGGFMGGRGRGGGGRGSSSYGGGGYGRGGRGGGGGGGGGQAGYGGSTSSVYGAGRQGGGGY
jgi:small nuclear ribonucleoprotein D3